MAFTFSYEASFIQRNGNHYLVENLFNIVKVRIPTRLDEMQPIPADSRRTM